MIIREHLTRMKNDPKNKNLAGYICVIGVNKARDIALVRAANKIGLTYDQLEEWCQSKLGRWFDDGTAHIINNSKLLYEIALNELKGTFDHFVSAEKHLSDLYKMVK